MSVWLQRLHEYRAIAVIRVPQLLLGQQLAHAVADGGIQLIEITWNSHQAAELITQLRQELPQCTIGAGTILDADQLQQAMIAGAQFCFTPHVNVELIRIARAWTVPIIPGALSPTEIMMAWRAGASSVKVFPIQAVGGADYIRALRGPLSQIPLIPTGGVTLGNTQEFLEAGATAVGLSSQLFSQSLIETQDWEGITKRARALMSRVAPFRRSHD